MEESKPKRFRKSLWVVKTVALCAAVVAVAVGINRGVEIVWDHIYAEYAEAYQWAEKKLTREVIVQEFVDPESVPTEMLIEQVAAEFKLNPIVLKAMALQESGSWNASNRMRHEPHLDEVFEKDIPKELKLTLIEREMWASSHGILQVIWGWHHQFCGLSGDDPKHPKFDWIRLHAPKENLACAAKVLKNRLQKYSYIKDRHQRLYMALRAYNGDVTKPATAVYADEVMAHMLGLMIEKIGDV